MASKFTPAERQALAQTVGINEQYLYQCLTGRRDMNPAEARRAEEVTNGVLDRRDLCQSTWRGIWPELSNKRSKKSSIASARAA